MEYKCLTLTDFVKIIFIYEIAALLFTLSGRYVIDRVFRTAFMQKIMHKKRK